LAGFLATTIVAILTTSGHPSWILIGVLAVALGGAIVGWFLTRPSGEDARAKGEPLALATSTTGDNSPAVSASHSGAGDIHIDQSTHHHAEAERAAQRSYRGERLLSKSAKQLMAYYDEHTSLQADRLVAPFLGKPLLVEGSVKNVSDLGEDGVLVLLQDDEGRWLSGGFADSWRDRLAEVDLDAHLSFMGLLRKVGGRTIDLIECELPDD
jgi:hypothetical protein